MDPNELIAVCNECHSDQPDKWVENNPFYKAGLPIACKFCGGGRVMIMRRQEREHVLANEDLRRGVGPNV